MKGSRDNQVVRWNPGSRNVRPGPGDVIIIVIILCIHTIWMMYMLLRMICMVHINGWQEQGFANHNAKGQKRTCSSTRSGLSLTSAAGLHQFRDFFFWCTCSKQCIKLKAVYLSSRPFCEKLKEFVEIPLNIAGAAADKLTCRLRMLLGKERTALMQAVIYYTVTAHVWPPSTMPPPMSSGNWKRSKLSKAQPAERVPATFAISSCFY